MITGARPTILFRFGYKIRPHGVQFNVAECHPQMTAGQCARIVAALPDVPTDLSSQRVTPQGILAQQGAKAAGEGVLAARDRDQMKMVAHQTPGQHIELVLLGSLGQAAEEKVAIPIAKEHLLPVIAALCDVMWESWHDKTRHPGHAN